MEALALDIVKYLNKEEGFQLRSQFKKDFKISKIHYQYEDSFKESIKNCLILFRLSNLLVDCNESLILMEGKENFIESGYNNADIIYIVSTDLKKTYISLIRKFALDEPYGINEMQLRNHYFPATYTTIQRCLYNESFKFGWHQLIGIEGGRSFVELDPDFPMIGGVKIGKNVSIGNNVIIYRGVTGFTEIGDNVVIHDNCIIAPDSKIPDNQIIHPFVVVNNRL